MPPAENSRGRVDARTDADGPTQRSGGPRSHGASSVSYEMTITTLMMGAVEWGAGGREGDKQGGGEMFINIFAPLPNPSDS